MSRNCAITMLAATALFASAAPAAPSGNAKIILLHHSTGQCIWDGGLAGCLAAHNAANKTAYRITERAFPADSPYGWENYPYDYWNIWVRHAGKKPFKNEPTLEMLTAAHDVIVLKHCFPVSSIEADTGRADVTSSEKRVENYKLQYAALKKKMRQFPRTKFIVWTGAALIRTETEPAAAKRAKAFFDWVVGTWDTQGDNIFIWDFRALQTEGGLYFKAAHAAGDSHPNEAFSRKVAPLLARRILDVIAGKGDAAPITGAGGKALVASPAQTQPAATTRPAAVAVVAPPAGEGRWVFDNAQDKSKAAQWPPAAAYAADGANHAVKIDFAAGKAEDWGEYGEHRIVRTRPAAKAVDVKAFKYLALRVKSDQDMQVVLGLVTLSDPAGNPDDQPFFSFNGYIRAKAGRWTWVVFDLSRLELSVERPAEFYDKVGKPSRTRALTTIKLSANAKNAKAALLLDDVMFLTAVPAALRPFVQGASPGD